MKHDHHNPYFRDYCWALIIEQRAWAEHFRTRTEEARQVMRDTEAACHRARRRYLRSNPPGLHTHFVYLSIDNEIEGCMYPPGDYNYGFLDFDLVTAKYSPMFPDMDFDDEGEDFFVYGTFDDCTKLAALLNTDVDRESSEYVGAVSCDKAAEILGVPNPLNGYPWGKE